MGVLAIFILLCLRKYFKPRTCATRKNYASNVKTRAIGTDTLPYICEIICDEINLNKQVFR